MPRTGRWLWCGIFSVSMVSTVPTVVTASGVAVSSLIFNSSPAAPASALGSVSSSCQKTAQSAKFQVFQWGQWGKLRPRHDLWPFAFLCSCGRARYLAPGKMEEPKIWFFWGFWIFGVYLRYCLPRTGCRLWCGGGVSILTFSFLTLMTLIGLVSQSLYHLRT